MPIEVEVDGVGVIEFPDGMSKDEIKSALNNKFGAQKGSSEDAPITAGALARQGFQGLTFGFGDEIEAFLRSALSEKDYYQERDRIRAEIENFRANNPGTALTAEILGGMITGGAGGAKVLGMKAFQNMSRLKALTSLGGIEGAILGAGNADEISDIPLSSATGAAIGAVGGAAGRGIEKGLKNIASLSPMGQANKKVKAALESSGVRSRAQLDRALSDLGDDAVIADINANTRGLGRAAWAESPNREAIESTLKRRMENQTKELGDALSDATGVNKSVYAATKELQDARKRLSDPLYRNARQEIVELTDDIVEGATTTYGKKAYKDAAIEYMSKYRKNDVDLDDLSFWDLWKRKIDGQISAAARKGDKGKVATLKSIKKQVVDSLDEQTNNAYQKARNAFAKPSRMIDALEEGRNVLRDTRTTPEEITDLLSGMSGDEKRSFLTGIVDEVKFMLSRGPEDAQKARKILRYPQVREKIKAAFGDNVDAFDKFVAKLGASMQKAETNSSVLAGSRTAPMQAEMRNLSRIANAGAEVLQNPMSIPTVARKLMAEGAANQVTPRMAQQTANLLYGQPTPVSMQGIFAPGLQNQYLMPGLLGGGLQLPYPLPK